MIAKSAMKIYLKDYLSILHRDFCKKSILFFLDNLNDISSIISNYHTISARRFNYLFSEKDEWRW
jgi:hypothetical protein